MQYILKLLAWFMTFFCSSQIYLKDIYREQFITNPKRSDGFGAQFQTIIYSVIYAELNGKQFLYTPFSKMEHNYNGDPDFLSKKERLINFLDNFPLNNKNISSNINFINFFESNLVQCCGSSSLKKIKKIFRENKEKNTYFKDDNFNIAIHVRRPNTHDSRLEGADTADGVFIQAIHALRSIYSLKMPLFHVYSQGKIDEFACFNAPDIVLHLNESVEDTFTSMVFADVLVAAASSLSYTAGILSDGVIYYIPFWHPPLPHWMSIARLQENK